MKSWEKSLFHWPSSEILGEEFIPLAFQYAHEADPDAELYYNDYGMDVQGRREGVVKLVRSLKEKGLRGRSCEACPFIEGKRIAY